MKIILTKLLTENVIVIDDLSFPKSTALNWSPIRSRTEDNCASIVCLWYQEQSHLSGIASTVQIVWPTSRIFGSLTWSAANFSCGPPTFSLIFSSSTPGCEGDLQYLAEEDNRGIPLSLWCLLRQKQQPRLTPHLFRLKRQTVSFPLAGPDNFPPNTVEIKWYFWHILPPQVYCINKRCLMPGQGTVHMSHWHISTLVSLVTRHCDPFHVRVHIVHYK